MPKTKEAFEAMREETRKKIEMSALKLFARKGLSVKVGEIAREAGLSQGLMYSHYPSKEALIAELVRQANTISSTEVGGIQDNKESARDKIMKMNYMMYGMLTTENPGIDYFLFMLQVGMSGGLGDVPEIMEAAQRADDPITSLTAIISQGQMEGTVVEGNPVQLAITYWAEIQGLCCYAILKMPIKPEPEMLARILLKEPN